MYNNPYINQFNPQLNIERINNQIAELEKMKNQLNTQPVAQPTNLTQNFQLAPTNNHGIRYANTIDDVGKEIIYFDTPFFSKDMSILWIKNTKGEIKTYELNEIVEKDEKDLQIAYLQAQLDELKGMIKNDANVTNVVSKQNATDTTEYDEPVGDEFKESKPTGLSKISRSKKE